MSHFGLTTPLPVTAVEPPAKDILYGLYDHQHRTFYEDDGGGSSSSERLCFVHSDPEYIRTTMNALWAHEDLFEGKPRTQMKFEEGAKKTNRWHSSGGGCMASGHYEIRAMMKESAAVYIAGRQEVIDRGNKQRAELAEQKRKFEEERQRKQKEEEERKAHYAKLAKRNEKRRQHRIDNNDEVNAKQREYRKGLRARKKAEKEERLRIGQAFWDELDAWKTANPGQEIGNDEFQKIRAKYYPPKDSK